MRSKEVAAEEEAEAEEAVVAASAEAVLAEAALGALAEVALELERAVAPRDSTRRMARSEKR